MRRERVACDRENLLRDLRADARQRDELLERQVEQLLHALDALLNEPLVPCP